MQEKFDHDFFQLKWEFLRCLQKTGQVSESLRYGGMLLEYSECAENNYIFLANLVHKEIQYEKDRNPESLKSYVEIVDVIAEYCKNNSDKTSAVKILVISLIPLSKMYYQRGKRNEALATINKAYCLCVEMFSDVIEINERILKALVLDQLLLIYTNDNIDHDIDALFNECINTYKEFNVINPNIDSIKERLGEMYSCMGGFHFNNKRITEAVACFKQALKILRQLDVKENNDIEHLNRLSIVYTRLGILYLEVGEYILALKCTKKSISLLNSILLAHPDNFIITMSLIPAIRNLGMIYINMGNMQEGYELLQESNQMLCHQYKKYPEISDIRQEFIILYSSMAEAYLKNNDIANSEIYYVKMVLTAFECHYEDIENYVYVRLAIISCILLANFYEAQGKINKSDEFYQKALLVCNEVVRVNPGLQEFFERKQFILNKLKTLSLYDS